MQENWRLGGLAVERVEEHVTLMIRRRYGGAEVVRSCDLRAQREMGPARDGTNEGRQQRDVAAARDQKRDIEKNEGEDEAEGTVFLSAETEMEGR